MERADAPVIPMEIQVCFSDDAVSVLKEAGSFLASEPVLHNLILTLLHARVTHPEPGRYWIAKRGDTVAGVVLQSPLTIAATLTPMSPDAAAAAADAIAESGVSLPGISGDAATAARFAGQWTERVKSAAVPFQGLRLYEMLEAGNRPDARGALRRGTPQDRELVVEWARRFHVEAGEGHGLPSGMIDRWLADGNLWLWDDGVPVCMTVLRDAVEGVVRIAPVFTPVEQRRRGYAAACVHDLSQQILSQGQRAILYTDLGNPTSNSVYRRIGFRAVAEGLRYRFE
jgi:predicted GNAT family acetyltransferase